MLVRIARFGLDALDPGERVGDAEMARVRRVAQRIDDPQIEPGERLGARVRHVDQVAGICDIAEAEAERLDVAVLLQERQRRDRPARPGIELPAARRLSPCMFRIGG